MLPRRDGIDVLATLRKCGIQTPILVLTAKDAVEDRVIGLDQGADDYLTKPFAFSELLARIRALLRRGRMDQILKLQHEDLEMDLVTHKVSRGAQSLDLTAKEFDMLEYLLRHSGTRRVAGDARARCVARDGHGLHRSTTSSTSRSRGCVARSTNRTKESCCTQSAASDTCWAGGRDENPPAKRARAAYALVRWRADAHRMHFFRRHSAFCRGAPLRRLGRATRPRDRDHRQDLSRGAGGTEGFGLPLGRHIVPGGRGRQHPSSDRSMGARRTGTRAASRRLRHRRYLGRRRTAAAIASSSVSGSSYRVAAAIEETSLRDTLWTLAVILAMGIPFAVGLAIAGGYFLAGRVLAPVGAMADKAREITAESLAERLPVDNAEDEFGRLATVFNDTLSRLQDAFERLRRFTADASHELRTPLTAMRSVGEVALRNTLDAGAYRDVIGSMLEEVDRLTRLVESLLILTRADSGKIQLAPETLDLGGLAGNVIDQLRVLADEKQQDLTLQAPIPVHAMGDAALLRHALMNLIHNAIKYTPNGGTITVEAECDEFRAGGDRGTRHRTGNSRSTSGSYFRSLLSRRRWPLQGRGRRRTGSRNRSLGDRGERRADSSSQAIGAWKLNLPMQISLLRKVRLTSLTAQPRKAAHVVPAAGLMLPS